MHDATLLAIAQQQPRTVGQLLRIPGIGPAKAERYGADLLALFVPPSGASSQRS
jgi:hypothetical protein